MSFFRLISTLLVIVMLAPLAALPAKAAAVSIVVNGTTVGFDQPPVERAGRVFVPLRGVFERLGASVVYANGQINATAPGRTISLHIGSTNATVNGKSAVIDVAPFLIGSRTLVPLRFVAQSLGSTVNYDNSTRVVAIKSGGAPAPVASSNAVDLLERKPGPETSVKASTPTISARFSKSVDPNSVTLALDGRTVGSRDFYNSADAFSYVPPAALPAAKHTIRVTGKSSDGASFDRSWSFFTGSSGAISLTVIKPAEGQRVGASFTITGRTAPNAHVRVAAAADVNVVGGIVRVPTGSQVNYTTADASGNFSQDVSLPALAGGRVVVVIQVTAPNGASASKQLHLTT
ncbi:MAG: copper amine oxidase N-terminal domain-containing protein [Candidatus Eremiobacteraeota bacterium]|nr:copper amine oxidase N-terminal domain-containing protein [Candidatus Eremiobacteraeota bacterium]